MPSNLQAYSFLSRQNLLGTGMSFKVLFSSSFSAAINCVTCGKYLLIFSSVSKDNGCLTSSWSIRSILALTQLIKNWTVYKCTFLMNHKTINHSNPYLNYYQGIKIFGGNFSQSLAIKRRVPEVPRPRAIKNWISGQGSSQPERGS